MSALKKQVGGKHYKHFAYQPIAFYHNARIPSNLAFAIKYIIRDKKDRQEDICKAIHMIELHLELNKKNFIKEIFPREEMLLFINENNFSAFIKFIICDIIHLMNSSNFEEMKDNSSIIFENLNKLKELK